MGPLKLYQNDAGFGEKKTGFSVSEPTNHFDIPIHISSSPMRIADIKTYRKSYFQLLYRKAPGTPSPDRFDLPSILFLIPRTMGKLMGVEIVIFQNCSICLQFVALR